MFQLIINIKILTGSFMLLSSLCLFYFHSLSPGAAFQVFNSHEWFSSRSSRPEKPGNRAAVRQWWRQTLNNQRDEVESSLLLLLKKDGQREAGTETGHIYSPHGGKPGLRSVCFEFAVNVLSPRNDSKVWDPGFGKLAKIWEWGPKAKSAGTLGSTP